MGNWLKQHLTLQVICYFLGQQVLKFLDLHSWFYLQFCYLSYKNPFYLSAISATSYLFNRIHFNKNNQNPHLLIHHAQKYALLVRWWVFVRSFEFNLARIEIVTCDHLNLLHFSFQASPYKPLGQKKPPLPLPHLFQSLSIQNHDHNFHQHFLSFSQKYGPDFFTARIL